jgi:hypothetical protein
MGPSDPGKGAVVNYDQSVFIGCGLMGALILSLSSWLVVAERANGSRLSLRATIAIGCLVIAASNAVLLEAQYRSRFGATPVPIRSITTPLSAVLLAAMFFLPLIVKEPGEVRLRLPATILKLFAVLIIAVNLFLAGAGP